MFDKAKFLRYIETDAFLRSTWADYRQMTPPAQQDSMLKALFNTYVGDNSMALSEYKAFR
jgi:hypothetical protein